MLRDMIKALDGFSQEGIFRKAGLESEMVILRGKIESGEPFQSLDQHSLATLMKVRSLPSLLGQLS